MQYCEKEELLASIYGFNHLGCSSLQSQAAVAGFRGIWECFVASLVRYRVMCSRLLLAHHSLPRHSLLTPICACRKREVQHHAGQPWQMATWQHLAALRPFLSGSNITWFGEYGCALLALRPPAEAHYQPAAGQVTLLLVGLDKWELAVHR